MNLINIIAEDLKLKESQVQTVLNMLSEGSTIPFIARYRKEITGGLDENQIKDIETYYAKQKSLEERREAVIRLIDEKGMLTDKLKDQLLKATTLKDIEDIYLPFKEKKKTKATEAVAKGLEPFAKIILAAQNYLDVKQKAQEFINDKVSTIEEAIEGAQFIIAEYASERVFFRKWVRNFILRNAKLKTKLKKSAVDEKEVYKTYYEFEKELRWLANYQVLAINRAEKAKVLTVTFDYSQTQVTDFLIKNMNRYNNDSTAPYIEAAVKDGFKRLIKPSIEREFRSDLTEKAGTGAIEIFANNLEQLLLTPAIKGKTVLGIDPGFRTGCKTAVIDRTGAPKTIGVIYVFKERDAYVTLDDTFKNFDIDVIVIGNGTASRETMELVAKYLKSRNMNIPFTIISEAGASVYSASKVAQKEFPKLQVEQRSAISIARRYQDALNELVKIEPKAIGVGQYQHDVNQKQLDAQLGFVVEKIVNQVGVDINTASAEVLQYISGLSSKVATNIVEHRTTNGVFKERKEIKKVKGLGSKTYEQAIGFLRIIDGLNKLDSTSIHPESYKIAKAIIKENKISLEQIGQANQLQELSIQELANKYESDKYTIQDIVDGISNPQRDVRDSYDAPILKTEILSIDNMEIGQVMEGRVQNVTEFGAFVDLGVKTAGLIHKSNMGEGYVKNPLEVVSVGKIVEVEIISLEKERKRIGLKLLKK
ncbi:Tex-like N-terminal domain-containing protein [Mycoplasma marinum]|uniref:RNA-binding transcriptional accessory protein n=1 Tax=Mycoplasma marinum TaxID=1937190 RepID=A0A4R0XL22_9MOLU|nr:Tex family protein [Mycoplasma marinum]TCG11343.1 RNA-binding transcriptional accessory protein [Mycoplasma marinum]